VVAGVTELRRGRPLRLLRRLEPARRTTEHRGDPAQARQPAPRAALAAPEAAPAAGMLLKKRHRALCRAVFRVLDRVAAMRFANVSEHNGGNCIGQSCCDGCKIPSGRRRPLGQNQHVLGLWAL
jgi:hypothetical protein